jgi:hypothetical protein
MRSSYVAVRGAVLLKTPNARQQAGRRRLAIVCALLALALASGFFGSMIHPNRDLSSRPATGPFSYFPSE